METKEMTVKDWLENVQDDEDTALKVWLAEQSKSKLINIIYSLLRETKQIL